MAAPNENLPPVGRLATERAYSRIIGGPSTNVTKYQRYIRQVDRRQSDLLGAVQLLGKSHERARRIIESDTPLSLNSYIGGALLYLASREEQAKLDRVSFLPLLVGDAGRAALKDIMLGDVPVDAQHNLVTGFEREMDETDINTVTDSPLRDALAINDAIFREYQSSFEASPFADDLTATVTNIARVMEMSAMVRVAAFPDQEPEFCDTMTRFWWHRTPALVTHGQIMGAADTRALIAYPE